MARMGWALFALLDDDGLVCVEEYKRQHLFLYMKA
jgi:hypothetical protein